MSFVQQVNCLKKCYEPRIINLLNHLGRVLRQRGMLTSDAVFSGINEYVWSLRIQSRAFPGQRFVAAFRLREFREEETVRFEFYVHKTTEGITEVIPPQEGMQTLSIRDLAAIGEHYLRVEASVSPTQIAKELQSEIARHLV